MPRRLHRSPLAVLLALLVQGASAQSPPALNTCSQNPQYQQLDFWIGDWDVTDRGRVIGRNRIEKTTAGCIVAEHYAQADGYTGNSISFYDAVLKRWRQTWVDATGGVGEFSGEFRDDAMRFEGETHRAGGEVILRRIILSRVGGGNVRQFSERSVDGGKTWTVAYDFLYVRRP